MENIVEIHLLLIILEIYVKHNSKGKTYEEFEAGMDRDNFLTAQEAIDWGLADEIVEKR